MGTVTTVSTVELQVKLGSGVYANVNGNVLTICARSESESISKALLALALDELSAEFEGIRR